MNLNLLFRVSSFFFENCGDKPRISRMAEVPIGKPGSPEIVGRGLW